MFSLASPVLAFLRYAPALRYPCFACVPAQAFLAWAFTGAAIHWIAAFYPTQPSALGPVKGVKNSDTYLYNFVLRLRFYTMLGLTKGRKDSGELEQLGVWATSNLIAPG